MASASLVAGILVSSYSASIFVISIETASTRLRSNSESARFVEAGQLTFHRLVQPDAGWTRTMRHWTNAVNSGPPGLDWNAVPETVITRRMRANATQHCRDYLSVLS